jgi:hypothetical protein
MELKVYEYLNYARNTGRIYCSANAKPNIANAARTAGRDAASHSAAEIAATSAGIAARSRGAAGPASAGQGSQESGRTKPLTD